MAKRASTNRGGARARAKATSRKSIPRVPPLRESASRVPLAEPAPEPLPAAQAKQAGHGVPQGAPPVVNTPARTVSSELQPISRIRWHDAGIKSSYANVCNVFSSREEVVILFGFSRDWSRGQGEVTIRLTDRIILSPHVAKQIAELLARVVKDYETRFGALGAGSPAAQGALPSP